MKQFGIRYFTFLYSWTLERTWGSWYPVGSTLKVTSTLGFQFFEGGKANRACGSSLCRWLADTTSVSINALFSFCPFVGVLGVLGGQYYSCPLELDDVGDLLKYVARQTHQYDGESRLLETCECMEVEPDVEDLVERADGEQHVTSGVVPVQEPGGLAADVFVGAVAPQRTGVHVHVVACHVQGD